MAEKLKKIECSPTCGFMVRSHDEKELVTIALEHAKRFHPDEKFTEKDVKSLIKEA